MTLKPHWTSVSVIRSACMRDCVCVGMRDCVCVGMRDCVCVLACMSRYLGQHSLCSSGNFTIPVVALLVSHAAHGISQHVHSQVFEAPVERIRARHRLWGYVWWS